MILTCQPKRLQIRKFNDVALSSRVIAFSICFPQKRSGSEVLGLRSYHIMEERRRGGDRSAISEEANDGYVQSSKVKLSHVWEAAMFLHRSSALILSSLLVALRSERLYLRSPAYVRVCPVKRHDKKDVMMALRTEEKQSHTLLECQMSEDVLWELCQACILFCWKA
ncbi:hypothetical protein DFH11DRAFT_1137476 [Phellopilus nigrolimitatus]|nr:hypothetical protein DFH11DRAFT_1137476 [Phellopilus nigrolimitatus]